MTYFEEGIAGTEDEIDRAFNIAILVVVPSLLVVQGVLASQESNAVKLSLVSFDPECHCLLAHCTTRRRRVCVLLSQEGSITNSLVRTHIQETLETQIKRTQIKFVASPEDYREGNVLSLEII